MHTQELTFQQQKVFASVKAWHIEVAEVGWEGSKGHFLGFNGVPSSNGKLPVRSPPPSPRHKLPGWLIKAKFVLTNSNPSKHLMHTVS